MSTYQASNSQYGNEVDAMSFAALTNGLALSNNLGLMIAGFPCDATTAWTTDLTLPVAWGSSMLLFKKIDSSTNPITINTSGTDVIEGGGTSIVLANQNDFVLLMGDISKAGTWLILQFGNSSTGAQYSNGNFGPGVTLTPLSTTAQTTLFSFTPSRNTLYRLDWFMEGLASGNGTGALTLTLNFWPYSSPGISQTLFNGTPGVSSQNQGSYVFWATPSGVVSFIASQVTGTTPLKLSCKVTALGN